MNGNVKPETMPVEKTEKPLAKEEVTKAIETENVETKENEVEAIDVNNIETKSENNPVPKVTETKKVAYTNEEKFAQMSRKNPTLMTLKQQLSLEFI